MKENFITKKEFNELKSEILKLQKLPKFKIGDKVKIDLDRYIYELSYSINKEEKDSWLKQSKFNNEMIIIDVIQKPYIDINNEISDCNNYYDLLDLKEKEKYLYEKEYSLILVKEDE